jgi:hypothetical protein
MNCDIAFDLITDRHGRHSAALHEHLAACPRCRQMLETLAPALDNLADDAAPFESAAATAYDWGDSERAASPEAVAIARQAAQRFHGDAAIPGSRWSRWARSGARYVAAFAVGACAAFVLLPRAGDNSERRLSAAVPVAEGQCTRRQCASESSDLSEPAVQQLVLSCMVCHVSSR